MGSKCISDPILFWLQAEAQQRAYRAELDEQVLLDLSWGHA